MLGLTWPAVSKLPGTAAWMVHAFCRRTAAAQWGCIGESSISLWAIHTLTRHLSLSSPRLFPFLGVCSWVLVTFVQGSNKRPHRFQPQNKTTNVINPRVSLLIISHLSDALQGIIFSSCLRISPARKNKQQVLKCCSKNHLHVQPPPFCPQFPLCLLISSSDMLLKDPSPPSFRRHREPGMKISLFCAPRYGKWEPFWFPERQGGLGRASRSQQPCV